MLLLIGFLFGQAHKQTITLVSRIYHLLAAWVRQSARDAKLLAHAEHIHCCDMLCVHLV